MSTTLTLPRPIRPDLLALTVLGVPAALVAFACAVSLLTPLTPHTIDAALARLDCGIGVGLWHYAQLHPWLGKPLGIVYIALPLAMMAGIIERPRTAALLIVAALSALPCYLLFPAVGPAHVGDPNAWRNCMPSMHVTWTLLLWMNARGRARMLFAAFAWLTALSTLTTGEHYLPDLIAALPWAWMLNESTKGKQWLAL